MMKNLGYYLYMYLTLYVPVINGTMRRYCLLLYLSAALYVILKNEFLFKRLYKSIQPIGYSIIALFGYVIINIFLNGANSIILTATFGMTIIPFLSAISFVILYIKKGRKNFINDYVHIAVLASIISIVLYLIPSLGKSVLIFMSGNEYSSIQRFYEDGRGYGFAGSLFYGYSITQAFAAFFALKSQNIGLKKYLYVILIFVSMILNARIGIFVFGGILLIDFILFTPIKQTIKLSIGVFCIITLAIQTGIYHEFQQSLEWALEGVYLVSDFMFGTELGSQYGHFNGLAGRFIIWPKNITEWIWGNGEYLLYGNKLVSSDVGFILQLNWGGIIYLILMLFPSIFVIKRCFLDKRWSLAIIIMVTIGICDWKGDLFTQSNYMFILIVFYFLLNKNNEKNIYNNCGLQRC